MKTKSLTPPYWTDISTPPAQYRWLDKNIKCDVVIIGSGIVGAMCAERFSQAGVNTVLVGEKPIGYGSTAFSQGVINYQTECGLLELAKSTGVDNAVTVFKLCEKSIDTLESLCEQFDINVDFTRTNLLYYTDNTTEVDKINQEYLARHHNGFSVEFLNTEKAQSNFSFPVQAGIISTGLCATFNPYLLTHALVKKAIQSKCQVYENTTVAYISGSDGNFKLYTTLGKIIRANKIIMATGPKAYKTLTVKPNKKLILSLVTRPLSDFPGWSGRCAILNSGKKHLRLRTTPDNRIIISGFDYSDPIKKRAAKTLFKNKMILDKFAMLQQKLISMFPGIRDIQPEYCYFSEYVHVKDSLPVMGQSQIPGISFALCPGENGTAFANIAADLLLALYQGNTLPHAAIFSPARFAEKK